MSPRRKREPSADSGLSRERVLEAAIVFADEHGVAALSMRKLAKELGVEAMSLYYYLPNKDAILDGMVDRVFASIQVPRVQGGWREQMRARAMSTREVLLAHPWAVSLLDSRANPGMATLRHHDAVIGCLLEAGFSVGMVAHAFALLDSFIYGFVMQEASLPFDSDDLSDDVDAMMPEEVAEALPNLARFTREHIMQPGYDFSAEFEFGLDLILDGLGARHEAAST